MPKVRLLFVSLCALCVLPLLGCTGGVSDVKKVTLAKNGGDRVFIVDARPNARTFSIGVTSDSPIEVVLSHGATEDAAESAATGKGSQTKRNVTQETIEYALPANNLLRINVNNLSGKADANVQVHIRGK